MAVSGTTYFLSDGLSVDVKLQGTTPVNAIAFADGWVGITAAGGNSGDSVSLYVEHREFRFDVGSLVILKGQTCYIDTSQMTGSQPTLAGYSTSAGAGKLALFKATTNKDASNYVHGILCVAEGGN